MVFEWQAFRFVLVLGIANGFADLTYICASNRMRIEPILLALQLTNTQNLLMITRFMFALSAVFFLTVASAIFGAEHPSGPGIKLPPTNVTTNTQPASQSRQVTAADISRAIKRNVGSERKKTADKKFHVKHQGKDLALDLVRVHDDAVASLGTARYFACVDMKAADGTNYDIDFFMAGQPGAMKVTETSVHKINGKLLYDWKETGGVWKKVAAKRS